MRRKPSQTETVRGHGIYVVLCSNVHITDDISNNHNRYQIAPVRPYFKFKPNHTLTQHVHWCVLVLVFNQVVLSNARLLPPGCRSILLDLLTFPREAFRFAYSGSAPDDPKKSSKPRLAAFFIHLLSTNRMLSILAVGNPLYPIFNHCDTFSGMT